MKYQLETIPVTDAWTSAPVCPLCLLMDGAEQRHIEYYLGNSVMNPETRVLVNKTGFCSRHFPMMRSAGHAHHLGLIAHTHLQTVRQNLTRKLNALSGRSPAKAALEFAERVQKQTKKCLICESMERDIKRYTFTAAVLYIREPDFRKRFDHAPSPCLPHAAQLAQTASETLKKKDAGMFLSALSSRLNRGLEELEQDVLKFTQKFDAQNDSVDWGDSREAHTRTVQMLSGRIIET